MWVSSNDNKRPAVDRRVVLASASPRRRELMSRLDVDFDVRPPEGDESQRQDNEPPTEYARRLSHDKALEVAREYKDGIVVAADTIVVLDDDVLGKPADAGEATEMLRQLRGRTHQVVTGLTIVDVGSSRALTSSKTTDVAMRDYSDNEIDAYVASGEPFDKAGAYAVQDGAFRPAEGVDGCYLNVVGLPLCELVALFGRLGIESALEPGWAVPGDCPDCGRIARQEGVVV